VNEDRVRELLRDRPVPDQDAAEARAWRVVSAAFEAEGRAPDSVRPRRGRLALALAAVLLLAAALALTPAGAKVGDLIGDVVDPGRDRAEPALTELPTGGRLLVESARGPWIVHRDGSKRLLGDYDQATWSPRGLFVAVTRPHELVAVDPVGEVRWSISQRGTIRDPGWAPSGLRVAYRSGDSLRVVAGDGTGDRVVDERVAPTAPIWQPGPRHLLTYVDRDGRVRLVDVDAGRRVWTSARFASRVKSLDWSSDGARLLVLTSSFYGVLDEHGRSIAKGATRGAAADATFSPDGPIALIRRSEAGTAAGRSELVLVNEFGEERRVFAGPGRFTGIAWSPDGRWLLLGWRDADQWLFIRPSDEKLVAVSNISRQFDPGGSGAAAFPRLAGWCCSPSSRGPP
jgi:dipeptidyl aminopeptidase/acylaminoacyl peptidase